MPSLSELPDGFPRKKFLHALRALGWEISEVGGKGSHYKATWPPTQKIIIVQYDFRKDVLYRDLCKTRWRSESSKFRAKNRKCDDVYLEDKRRSSCDFGAEIWKSQ